MFRHKIINTVNQNRMKSTSGKSKKIILIPVKEFKCKKNVGIIQKAPVFRVVGAFFQIFNYNNIKIVA